MARKRRNSVKRVYVRRRGGVMAELLKGGVGGIGGYVVSTMVGDRIAKTTGLADNGYGELAIRLGVGVAGAYALKRVSRPAAIAFGTGAAIAAGITLLNNVTKKAAPGSVSGYNDAPGALPEFTAESVAGYSNFAYAN